MVRRVFAEGIFFDIKTPSGIRDKQTVINALAGCHDILSTNTIATIEVIVLQPWIANTYT